MRKDREITTNAKQSSTITDALQQYTKYTLNCWERTVDILRKEALDKEQPFGKRCPGGLNLKRICGIEFFRRIDDKHPERVIAALQYIFSHPLVTKRKTYFGMALISLFVENEKKSGEYLLEFTPSVIRHYLADDLSVEYDVDLVTSFRTASAQVLYKKACMFDNSADGYFDMTEDEIRLTFCIDKINDVDNLKQHKIKDISNLPLTISEEYKRFDNLVKLIQRGLDEIEDAYKEGRCPFFLSHEILKMRKYTGKRGRPQYEDLVRFYILSEDYDATENVEVEDAVIVEELPLAPGQGELQVPVIEPEISFEYDENELTKNLQKFRDEITDIFKQAKATYTKGYISQICTMVKERYSSYPTLPSAILLWIEFMRKVVADQRKEPVDLLRMVTSRIERNCHVYYANNRNSAKKKRLHADDDLTPILPLGALSLDQEKEIISNDSTFFAVVCKECSLSEEAVRKHLEAFYKDREKNGDSYCETSVDVRKAFMEWLFLDSSSSGEPEKDSGTSTFKSEQTPPKTSQGSWDGEDAKVYDSVESEVDALRSNPDWLKTVFERFIFLNHSESAFNEYLNRWVLELKASGKKHKNLGDAKSHFTNWLIIQEEKNNKNKCNYGTNNNGYRTSEDIITGAIGIMQELRAEGSRPKKKLPVV